MKKYPGLLAIMLLTSAGFINVNAQEVKYVSPVAPVEETKAPGLKVKLISDSASIKTFVLVFAPGDEVRSGLTSFAKKYKVAAAHYTGIGDAVTAKMGWYDYQGKMFKVIPVDSVELTSLTGNITIAEDKPVAHSHVTLSDSDGIVHGGHLLELIVGPTVEIFVTVLPAKVTKKLDKRFDAAIIE